MSRDGAVTIAWADGEYRFKIAIGQVRELQEKCDAGPQHIYSRLANGTWVIDDIRETIRIGLIGGGMAPPAALKLIQRYVDERPWLESRETAAAVLAAGLVGAGDEPLGKAGAAKDQDQLSPEESSPSPPSTAPAPPSASAPPPSTP